MPTYSDQTGHIVKLDKTPGRIISIVPSQSEFIWDLGIRKELVGITKFCIHPGEMYQRVDRVGGTKKLNIEKIKSLAPDLIIGNKEENSKEDIELLRREFPVWMSDIFTLHDAFDMMRSIGEILAKNKEADDIISTIEANFKSLNTVSLKGRTAAYLIWYNPVMVAAKNTFIDYILNTLGLVNAFENFERYPQLSSDQLKKASPEIIFLSSEPYPFGEKHVEEFTTLSPSSKVILVDGEMFSWYGSRLQFAPSYFDNLAL